MLNIVSHLKISELESLFQTTTFKKIFLQSLFLSLCVSLISVSSALIISLIIREQKPLIQQFFVLCFTIPTLMPSMSLGMGIMFLFSRSGMINQVFGWQINILGFRGLLLGLVLYTMPFAVLQIFDVLRYEDTHLHIESKALNLGSLSRLYILTLPRSKSAVKRAFFSTFLLSFTDFGINIMISGQYKTLSLSLYQEIIGRMNLSKAALISILMWIPLFVLFVFCMKGASVVFKRNEKGTISSFFLNNKGKVISFIILAVCVFLFLLPIVSFIASSFRPTNLNNPDRMQNYTSLLNFNIKQYLINSLVISFSVSFFGSILCCITAYFTSKVNNSITRILKVIAVIPYSVTRAYNWLGIYNKL